MATPDPHPEPPSRPDLEDCCRGGCTVCVFDVYEEALARYEAALAAWLARQGSVPDGD
ncbi:oxidoreductase-like domain-containing protein [Massilia sp. YMA4]|uniref:oxidoreductase-like domain-containing protein n=1 Tax=Massilia sp. YMA4 TaxID=1593482 RepID=UPI000DD16D21|nr:oxidoreductase-like domain-containing protein [Massilia sp. YMA4]AXA94077.1 hypothetical protein DPH57_24840 [Massilia sp. YMA4]